LTDPHLKRHESCTSRIFSAKPLDYASIADSLLGSTRHFTAIHHS